MFFNQFIRMETPKKNAGGGIEKEHKKAGIFTSEEDFNEEERKETTVINPFANSIDSPTKKFGLTKEISRR